MKMKLEVIVVPVRDVDRAKKFYEGLGFRMDIDYVGETGFRVVQLTPPESECSIIIGEGITTAAAGSTQGLQLVVDDIETAQKELTSRGAKTSDIFHDEGGIFYHAEGKKRVTGADPKHTDYGSFISFNDPDGNGWVVQEVKKRAPGR